MSSVTEQILNAEAKPKQKKRSEGNIVRLVLNLPEFKAIDIEARIIGVDPDPLIKYTRKDRVTGKPVRGRRDDFLHVIELDGSFGEEITEDRVAYIQLDEEGNELGEMGEFPMTKTIGLDPQGQAVAELIPVTDRDNYANTAHAAIHTNTNVGGLYDLCIFLQKQDKAILTPIIRRKGRKVYQGILYPILSGDRFVLAVDLAEGFLDYSEYMMNVPQLGAMLQGANTLGEKYQAPIPKIPLLVKRPKQQA